MKPEYKLVAKARYVETTSALATEIWRECYARRFAPKALAALTEACVGVEAIEEKMDADFNYFLILLAGKPVGYFAWEMQNTALHLTDLYLQPQVRSRAIGRDVMAYCERLARADGKGRVWLAVNAKALDAQRFFKELGYRKLSETTTVTAGVEHTDLPMEKHL